MTSTWTDYVGDHGDVLSPDELEEREAIETIERAEEEAAAARPQPATPSSILDAWRAEGPLVHEPTGIEALDEATGGGPVYGSRWYVIGAPDAGKTALLVQIADAYARRGVTVGLLAVDEEPSDIVTRLAQRAGVQRYQCERRSDEDLAEIAASIGELPLLLYDAEWTIERAAEDLASRAQMRRTRAMLGIDSVQTVRCEVELAAPRELSTAEAVAARVGAIRSCALRHSLITVSTSEMSRGAYRSRHTAEQIDPMAAGKWSGTIEYSARVLLALRSVADEPSLLELALPKNKHGAPRDPIYLRIDRTRQELTESGYSPPADEEPGATARDVARAAQVVSDAATLAVVLVGRPGLTSRDLRAAARAEAGLGKDRVDAASVRLGAALVRVEGRGADGRGRAVHHHLRGSELPVDVLAAVPLEERPRVLAARPPEVSV